MNRDIIPSRDMDFNGFQSVLIAWAAANQAGWNIPADEVNNLSPLSSAWETAWDAAKNKNTRTTQQIRDKDVAREALVAYLRYFLQRFIVRNPAITEGQLLAMGIKPRNRHRSPIHPPATSPLLNISGGPGNSVAIKFTEALDADGATRRGKPIGVARIEYKYNIGTVPVSADQCTLVGSATRNPVRFYSNPVYAGRRVYLFARWVTAKNEAGPWTSMYTFVMP